MNASRDSLMVAPDNAAMFSGLARRYDLLNGILSFRLDRSWRRTAVRTLQPVEGEYLDVGCGTGDVALEIVKQEPAAKVIGIDPAESMLGIGRLKSERAGVSDRIEFQSADAMAMPFEGNRFHGATCAFCIRNIVDHSAALSEMFRVIRPGGRLVILELTRPNNLLMRGMHSMYNATWVPLMGWLLSNGDAYRYLIKSIKKFADTHAIAEKMNQAGFTGVTVRPLYGGIVSLFYGDVPEEEPSGATA